MDKFWLKYEDKDRLIRDWYMEAAINYARHVFSIIVMEINDIPH